jgi:propionate kinase
LRQFEVSLLDCTLTSNHVHLLVEAQERSRLSGFIQLLRSGQAAARIALACSREVLILHCMASASQPGRGPYVLTINSGSSSIKFALFNAREPLRRILKGKFERVGLPDGDLTIEDLERRTREARPLHLTNHAACVPPLIEWLERRVSLKSVGAIGHRVVHGGTKYLETQPVTSEMLAELHRLSPFVPDHLPSSLMLMEAIGKEYGHVPQVACFDTAFHASMPRVAKLLPIPRRFDAKGIRRYGFHGLSYAFLMEELGRIAGAAARGRVILAHLGNGASMAAVRDGKCVDTTMAFTPTAGLVMSTRPGDLDPGLFTYLSRVEGMTGEQFHKMEHDRSGLLGVSETSSDMRDLLEREEDDVRSAEAVALFCRQARKWIGALAAVLGGVDTLVFAGGIGENAPVVRARICEGLEFLGIELDAERNRTDAAVISKQGGRAVVRVMRTDEELYIAQSVVRLLGDFEPVTTGSRQGR